MYFQTLTDYGNGTQQSGVFTCTRQGTYHFQVYAMSELDDRTFLDLYLNNQIVATMRGYSSNKRSNSANTALLRLQVGNTVMVKTRDQVDVSLATKTSGGLYTSFTGLQIDSFNGNMIFVLECVFCFKQNSKDSLHFYAFESRHRLSYCPFFSNFLSEP